MLKIRGILKKMLAKSREDRGSSALISFILLVPLFLGLVITAVDVSFYFSNRGQMEAIASDAARTVGIYGGAGTSDMATTIEKKYGNPTGACTSGRKDLNDGTSEENTARKNMFKEILGSNPANHTSVECNVAAAIANQQGLVSVSFDRSINPDLGVKCGPAVAATIGTRTYCDINYAYTGMPGSPMSFIQFRMEDGQSSGLLGVNKITKSSESEVANPPTTSRG